MGPLAIVGAAPQPRSPADIVQHFGADFRAPQDSLIGMVCDQVSRGRRPYIEQADRLIDLVYADSAYRFSLRELVARISTFQLVRTTTELPDFGDELTRRLYATYVTCLDPAGLAYALDMKSDDRGCLASIMRSPSFGQICVSRTKPGVVRANHYHNLKSEKFLVVEGEALIRLRRTDSDMVVEHRVSGGSFEFVDIPPGYAHSIANVGTTEMVLIFWISEGHEAGNTDTYPAVV